MKLPIYLDYQSTTPIDPRVADHMCHILKNEIGNPHSRTHEFGWIAEGIVDEAREDVANLINAHPKEIIFTSGATESNNMAIKGAYEFYKNDNNHVITLPTEHKCVINSCREIEQQGGKVTFLKVQKNGIVDLKELENAITDKTLLISIMAVNNEIGVIQPLKEIGQLCRKKNVFFHTDAAQAFGKIPLDVNELNIDLMSISAHKIYGPKGVGALYIRSKPRVRIRPLITGGGQERGLRSGTLAPFLVAGLGKAAKIAKEEIQQDYEKCTKLKDRFMNALKDIKEVYLNGDKKHRVPSNINLSFAGIEGESFIMATKDLAISSGSACTSDSLEPSYVLYSLGVGDDLVRTSVRFGFGRFTTEEEVDYATNLIKEKVQKLRELSPLWEMTEEGVDIKSIECSGH
ncbi:MAG: cysteine desulfurase [Rickettsiales bacterium]|jgi:cysteine desulfurase